MSPRLLFISGRNVTALVLAACWLLGCATAAQRQAQQMAVANQQAATEGLACISAVYNNPQYSSLTAHFPFDPRKATIEQLTDRTLFDRSDIPLVSDMHSKSVVCRQQLLDTISRTTPALVPVLVESYAASDRDLLELVQRKISWGERVSRGKANAESMVVKLAAVGQQVAANLNAAHQQELANRQAAMNAAAQYMATSASLMQQQQMIYNMNRPVMTTCSQTGSFVNCMSR